jgi:hypothetical protein
MKVMKKIVKKLLSELYDDDSYLDCVDYLNDWYDDGNKLKTLDDVINFLNEIKDNVVE